jgi:hypothetical protein
VYFYGRTNSVRRNFFIVSFYDSVLYPLRSLRLRGLFFSVFTPRAAEQSRKIRSLENGPIVLLFFILSFEL